LVFAAYIVGVFFQSSFERWTRLATPAARSPLYGIWDVEKMSMDGVERAPLVTDYDRWRRVVFNSPAFVSFQRMDETFTNYGTTIDVDRGTIALSRPADQSWGAQLAFERPDSDHLTLRGTIDRHRITLSLRRFDHTKMLLVSRGFNWIQEYPFNR
jgi:hypothetical protein